MKWYDIAFLSVAGKSVSFATAHQECATLDPSPIQKLGDAHRYTKYRSRQLQSRNSVYLGPNDNVFQHESDTTNHNREPFDWSSDAKFDPTIDLVFHILADDTGDSKAADLWTDQAIDAEVIRINRHFQGTPFKFKLLSTIRTSNTEWANTKITDDDVIDDMVADLRVGGADVSNIFVTDGTCLTTGGWAQYPFDHGFFPPGQYSIGDWIFLCSKYIGRINEDYEHTVLTHELGHWMGLKHTFANNDCDPSNHNDFVDDTPQHLEGRDGCPLNSNTCPKLAGRDPVQNFMNAAICRNEFTPGQVARMYTQFHQYRRRLEPCYVAHEIDAKFEVRFDGHPEQTMVAYAEYIDGDRDWTDLKELEPEQTFDFSNQAFSRELCLLKQTMYSFIVRDTAEDGLQSPGYVSLVINGREIVRESSFDEEWASTFVVADFCANGQSLFALDIKFDYDEEDISWEIRRANSTEVVVSRALTATYTDIAYHRMYFEKCLGGGDYVFTIFDSEGDGLEDSGYYKVSLGGEELYLGGGDDGFLSSESLSFNVTSQAFSHFWSSSIVFASMLVFSITYL